MKSSVLRNRYWLAALLAASISGVGVALFWKDLPTTLPQFTTSAIAERPVSLYFIVASDRRFVAVPKTFRAASEETALKMALDALLNEPGEGKFYSAIPRNVKLLDISLRDREVHLNLSREFATGGGSASMTGRLVQLLYTATSIDPQAQIYLSVEGKPLHYLGGEGLEISQPISRKDFAATF